MMTWLPDWRAFSKPRRSSARITAAPETRGSLSLIPARGSGAHPQSSLHATQQYVEQLLG